MVKRTFRVEGMHCPNCAMSIEGIEDDLDGINKICASYIKGNLVVEYDETIINESRIILEVEKHGYQVIPI